MKRIILFRHGKSEWKPGVPDFDRELKPKGIKRTKRTAKELAKIPGLKIDLWYSSPARRAERTAIIASKCFTPKPEIRLNHKLYNFSYADLTWFIRRLNDSFQTIVLFGHNEAFTKFINEMGDRPLDNLPTSGIAIMEFDISNWIEIKKGRTIRIITPKAIG